MRMHIIIKHMDNEVNDNKTNIRKSCKKKKEKRIGQLLLSFGFQHEIDINGKNRIDFIHFESGRIS